MSRGKKPVIAICVLVISHFVILLAGFFAPYAFDAQNRNLAFAPPSQVHFLDAQHHLHLRPFIYRWTPRTGSSSEYDEDRSVAFPIRFFVLGSPYKLLGTIVSRRHLFGVEGVARLLLIGGDAFGRDEFSRLLYGGRTSLLAGMLATLISLSIGLVLGGLAGYYGRWVDDIVMRATRGFPNGSVAVSASFRAGIPAPTDQCQHYFPDVDRGPGSAWVGEAGAFNPRSRVKRQTT